MYQSQNTSDETCYLKTLSYTTSATFIKPEFILLILIALNFIKQYTEDLI